MLSILMIEASSVIGRSRHLRSEMLIDWGLLSRKVIGRYILESFRGMCGSLRSRLDYVCYQNRVNFSWWLLFGIVFTHLTPYIVIMT